MGGRLSYIVARSGVEGKVETASVVLRAFEEWELLNEILIRTKVTG